MEILQILLAIILVVSSASLLSSLGEVDKPREGNFWANQRYYSALCIIGTITSIIIIAINKS